MTETLILKLITGELIIGEVELIENKQAYLIKCPLDIFFKRYDADSHDHAIISLFPWLPKEFILNDSVVLNINQISYINNPSILFVELYQKASILFQKKWHVMQQAIDEQIKFIIQQHDYLMNDTSTEEDILEEEMLEDINEAIDEYLKRNIDKANKVIH